MRVLVTRTPEAAARTAARLRRAGHQPVRLALAADRDKGLPPPAGDFDGVILTSAAAARALAARPGGLPRELARLPAFCVGVSTAHAARRAGFGDVQPGPGTAAGLAASLTERFGGRPARLLYLAGEDRAFDMTAALGRAGISLAMAEVYRVELTDPGPGRLADALGKCAGGAVLLYSSRMAAHLFALAGQHRLGDRLAGLTFMAISENVAAAIPDRRNFSVLVAESPDENGLLRLLSRRGRGSAGHGSGATFSGA